MLLTSLTELVLRDNRDIQGPLPSEVGNLVSLEYLHMDGAKLSGSTLPSELGRLANLVHLSFENCYLTGSIPTEFGNLSELYYLYLNDNNLDGPILPNSIGNMRNLRRLSLNNNLLTSTIPAQLSRLTNLFYINLSNNSLTGRVPASLDRLRDTMQDVYLYGNNLTGGLETLFCGSPREDWPVDLFEDFQVDCGLVCNCCTLACVSLKGTGAG